MNACDNARTSSGKAPNRQLTQLLRGLALVLVMSVITGSLLVVTGQVHLSQAGGRFLGSLIYSACICIPASVLLYTFSQRYGDRSPRMVIGVQLAILLATALMGSLAAAISPVEW